MMPRWQRLRWLDFSPVPVGASSAACVCMWVCVRGIGRLRSSSVKWRLLIQVWKGSNNRYHDGSTAILPSSRVYWVQRIASIQCALRVANECLEVPRQVPFWIMDSAWDSSTLVSKTFLTPATEATRVTVSSESTPPMWSSSHTSHTHLFLCFDHMKTPSACELCSENMLIEG